MASEHSFDIEAGFDFQELRNSVDQAKREAQNRYDLKDSNVEIELSETQITINAENEHQIDAIDGILLKKMIGRSVSPKILDRQKIQQVGGMRVKQEIKLIKALDQENAKKISKILRDDFSKVKANIQGDAIRVSAKSIDDLQAVIAHLKSLDNIELPLQYSNFR